MTIHSFISNIFHKPYTKVKHILLHNRWHVVVKYIEIFFVWSGGMVNSLYLKFLAFFLFQDAHVYISIAFGDICFTYVELFVV